MPFPGVGLSTVAMVRGNGYQPLACPLPGSCLFVLARGRAGLPALAVVADWPMAVAARTGRGYKLAAGRAEGRVLARMPLSLEPLGEATVSGGRVHLPSPPSPPPTWILLDQGECEREAVEAVGKALSMRPLLLILVYPWTMGARLSRLPPWPPLAVPERCPEPPGLRSPARVPPRASLYG